MNSKFLKKVALSCLVLGAVNYGNIGNTMDALEQPYDDVNNDTKFFLMTGNVVLEQITDEKIKNATKMFESNLSNFDNLRRDDNAIKEDVEIVNKYISKLSNRLNEYYVGEGKRFDVADSLLSISDKLDMIEDEKSFIEACKSIVATEVGDKLTKQFKDNQDAVENIYKIFTDKLSECFAEYKFSEFYNAVTTSISKVRSDFTEFLLLYLDYGKFFLEELLKYNDKDGSYPYSFLCSYVINKESQKITTSLEKSLLSDAGSAKMLSPSKLNDSDILRYFYIFGSRSARMKQLKAMDLENVDQIDTRIVNKQVQDFTEVDTKIAEFVTAVSKLYGGDEVDEKDNYNMFSVVDIIKGIEDFACEILDESIVEYNNNQSKLRKNKQDLVFDVSEEQSIMPAMRKGNAGRNISSAKGILFKKLQQNLDMKQEIDVTANTGDSNKNKNIINDGDSNSQSYQVNIKKKKKKRNDKTTRSQPMNRSPEKITTSEENKLKIKETTTGEENNNEKIKENIAGVENEIIIKKTTTDEEDNTKEREGKIKDEEKKASE